MKRHTIAFLDDLVRLLGPINSLLFIYGWEKVLNAFQIILYLLKLKLWWTNITIASYVAVCIIFHVVTRVLFLAVSVILRAQPVIIQTRQPPEALALPNELQDTRDAIVSN